MLTATTVQSWDILYTGLYENDKIWENYIVLKYVLFAI
jgi:hypothetical protein